MAFGGVHTASGVKRVMAFKGGLSCPRSHHKQVVVIMAGLPTHSRPHTHYIGALVHRQEW